MAKRRKKLPPDLVEQLEAAGLLTSPAELQVELEAAGLLTSPAELQAELEAAGLLTSPAELEAELEVSPVKKPVTLNEAGSPSSPDRIPLVPDPVKKPVTLNEAPPVADDPGGAAKKQSSEQRRARLHAIEEDLQGRVKVPLYRKVQEERTREKRRRAQRTRRQIKSGRFKIIDTGAFWMLVPQSIACQHCGESFVPKRTTARFCSTKCRVSWNRAHKSRRR